MNDSQHGWINLFCILQENDLQMGVFIKSHRKGMTVNTVLQKYLDGFERISWN